MMAVILASANRPRELAHWSKYLSQQSVPPAQVIYSLSSAADLPSDTALFDGAEVLFGPPGLTCQRNRGLDRLRPECTLVAFFDDDYVPSRRALARLSAFFAAHPDVVGADGVLLADGSKGPGLDESAARRLVEVHDEECATGVRVLMDLPGLYGCNMVYRTSAIGRVRFDEVLPLYGWQEDVDFAARLRGRGRIVRTDALVGVHRGVKTGRASGKKFGYSQIANPLYLASKGSVTSAFAGRLILRNLASNHLRALRPEPWVDRAGRVRGNWMAIGDALRGRVSPTRILDM